MANIVYTSDNGYTGILYGKHSLAVGIVLDNGEFKENLHSGSRNINTYEELKNFVDYFPQFLDTLFGGD
jgi:hypothetical protein